MGGNPLLTLNPMVHDFLDRPADGIPHGKSKKHHLSRGKSLPALESF